MQIHYNVKDYGATGDGITKDTVALQNTIDACFAAGGGRVILPAGTYLSGTLWLKSHVEFHLCSGATLLGSSDREDYNLDDAFPENFTSERERATGAHLLIAYRQENVVISGNGTIHGNASAFFEPFSETTHTGYRSKNKNFAIRSWRPSQMVFFCLSRRSALRDVSLIDSPYWNLFIHGCEDMRIRGLRISNSPFIPNGDGIDIDCSRNVIVSDCIIESGDDCITLRGNQQRFAGEEKPCENVVVANCILRTPCNAIRVGVGNGQIRRCRFNNIIIYDTRTGISMVSAYAEGREKGCSIEDIQFSDFQMDVCIPMAIGIGYPTEVLPVFSDIHFSDFQITATAAAQWVGHETIPLRRMSIRNCRIKIQGGAENELYRQELPERVLHQGYPGRDGKPALPCAFFGEWLEDAIFENVQIRWENIRTIWQYGFLFRNSDRIRLQNLIGMQPQEKESKLIEYRLCEQVEISNCRSQIGDPAFDFAASIESNIGLP